MAIFVVDATYALSMVVAPEYQQQALNSENLKLFWILAAIAFAFLVIAGAVVYLVVELLKTRDKVMKIVEDLHGKAQPIIASSTKLIQDLTPKVQDITSNVQHISFVARNKVEEFEPTISAANQTVKDANDKTHEQIVRVNEMITNVLNSTTEIVDKVDATIKAPFREASGMWAGVKAGVDTLVNGGKGFGRRGSGRTGSGHTGSGQRPVYRPSSPVVEDPAYPTHADRSETPASAAAAAASAAFSRAEKQDPTL